ncbi:phage major capsid protein [Devosia sp.]|uniref:phage major capsid protein n=1 Tax=Devosia sp. TaxID=1871048 RepID=UPI001ACF07CB|nr:phage major capsid protein [Devosia sp.]MBN9309005.1 phage major capsid protein [Devosia sp.]
MDTDAIADLLKEQGTAIETFRKNMEGALSKERKEREELEARLNRKGTGVAVELSSDPGAIREIGEAFRSFIKSGDKSGFQELERKGMMVGSDPDGGYAVIPEFSNQITQSLKDVSPMRSIANVRTISTDSLEELYDIDDADAAWVGEVDSRPATDNPQLGKWRIEPGEIYAMPKASQKLLDDAAIDIGQWLVEKITTRFAQKEGTAFVSGNGLGKPRGFLDYGATASSDPDSTRAWGRLQYVATGVDGDWAASVKGDKLIDLQAELKAQYLPGAVWVMNRRIRADVRKFKDGQNNYLWQPAQFAGQPDLLLGHPVVLDEEMPAKASNAFPIAFGNFKAGYTIVDRHGIKVLRDPYTAKPYVLFYCYARVGGDVTNFEAIKLLKLGTS